MLLDSADVALIRSHLTDGTSLTTDQKYRADINMDGKVNFVDISIIVNNFNTGDKTLFEYYVDTIR